MSSNFDAELWREQRGSDALDNPRVEQVVPLEEGGHIREGMRRVEVAELLGPPDRSTLRNDYYELGASPFGVHFERYAIEYNDLDQVVRFDIERR
ncbi:hypothetical protein [Lysobacter sp. CA196]|uniref:hypothetical protein n=1 Tax=Lysobacter sp. CA196 TaxID=3455606 RepID=UPI003F8D65E7